VAHHHDADIVVARLVTGEIIDGGPQRKDHLAARGTQRAPGACFRLLNWLV
jgi:hypothetical protein